MRYAIAAALAKPTCEILVKGKPKIDRYLPMGDFAIFDMASRLGNLKPTKVMNRFSGFFNSGPYRFVASRGRTARDLNGFEYFSLHDCPRSVCGLKGNLHFCSARALEVSELLGSELLFAKITNVIGRPESIDDVCRLVASGESGRRLPPALSVQSAVSVC
jgi:hypothetical protein